MSDDTAAVDLDDGDAADADGPVALDHPLLERLARAYPSAVFNQREFIDGSAQDVVSVAPDELVGFMETAHGVGYRMFVDLCGVDYLRRRPRFDVVINVLAMDPPHRLIVVVGVPEDEPVVSSITSVYPGANFYERETFDLFGIRFDGHPDLTRILMPDDWDGHPLRKDYGVGSVPVQFKEAHRAT